MYIPFFKKCPNLMKDIYYRPYYYNKRMETIERLEKEGKIYVLRPSISVPSKMDTTREHLQYFYGHGYYVMDKEFDQMREFLGV